MSASTQAVPTAKPTFDATMLALDAVDTLLHREKVKLDELNSDEYDEALRRTIREYLQTEGREVSDEILEEAVGKARKERLTFAPAKRGVERGLATAYVRRGVYGRRSAIAAAAVAAISVSSWLTYDLAVVRPREREIARIETLFGTTLPREIGVAVGEARVAGKLAPQGDGSVTADQVVDAIEKRGGEAIRLRDEKAARLAISDARTATDSFKRDAFVAGLRKQVEVVVADAATEQMDAHARSMLAVKIEALGSAADRGDQKQFDLAKSDLDAARKFIRTPFSIRIASRTGVNSYVTRLYKKQMPTYYVVVEAVDAAGNLGVASILNAERGRVESVTNWGIAVTKDFYDSVKEDKKDGIVNKSAAGSKAAGTVDFTWTIPVTGDQMITRW
jgi:hypothetical protein